LNLRFASLKVTDWGCETTFEDGSVVSAWPHDTPRYHVISHRLGYGDFLHRYCVEHEFAHEFVSERLCNRPSIVLWALAHQKQPHLSKAIQEELLAQALQRWLRANEEPIVAGVDWHALKAEALPLFDSLWI
jgi:hypothetical protein